MTEQGRAADIAATLHDLHAARAHHARVLEDREAKQAHRDFSAARVHRLQTQLDQLTQETT